LSGVLADMGFDVESLRRVGDRLWLSPVLIWRRTVAMSYGGSPRVVEPWLNLDPRELHSATDRRSKLS